MVCEVYGAVRRGFEGGRMLAGRDWERENDDTRCEQSSAV